MRIPFGLIALGLLCLLAATQIAQTGEFDARNFIALIVLPEAAIGLVNLGVLWLVVRFLFSPLGRM